MNHKLDPFVREAFHHFARNGVWGTCADCPYDGEHRRLPELCANYKRYDHQLDFLSLVRYAGQLRGLTKEIDLITIVRKHFGQQCWIKLQANNPVLYAMPEHGNAWYKVTVENGKITNTERLAEEPDACIPHEAS